MTETNGFDQYKKLILHELQENAKTVKELDRKIDHIQIDLADMKGKAKVWSLFAGLVGGGVMSVVIGIIVRFVG